MHPAQIKAALAVAGFKQVDLARDLGLAGNTINAVINGRSRSKQVEERIAEITRLPLAELWPQWYGEGPLTLISIERELVLLFRAATPERRARALKLLADGTDPGGGHQVHADRGSIASMGNVEIGVPRKKK